MLYYYYFHRGECPLTQEKQNESKNTETYTHTFPFMHAGTCHGRQKEEFVKVQGNMYSAEFLGGFTAALTTSSDCLQNTHNIFLEGNSSIRVQDQFLLSKICVNNVFSFPNAISMVLMLKIGTSELYLVCGDERNL